MREPPADPVGQLDRLRWDARVLTRGRRSRALRLPFDPAFTMVAFYRANRWAYLRFGRRWQAVRALLSPLNVLLRILVPSELDYRSDLGAGFRVLHPSLGVVVSANAVVGRGCILAGGNAIGGGPVRIGDHVQLGINAVVIGPLTIGDHVTVGAGAVVVTDLPGPGTAVGNPARMVERTRSDAS